MTIVAGAALGGLMRSLLGRANGVRLGTVSWPWGTLVSNLAACAVAGAAVSSQLNPALGAGFAGALSTWSSFAVELAELDASSRRQAGGYLVTSLILGGAAAACSATHL